MKIKKSPYIAMVALVAALTACDAGGSSPSSVEDKAAKLAADSMRAISSAPAQAVDHATWSSCSEETPGNSRFMYERSVQLTIGKADQQSALDEVSAAWKKAGYSQRGSHPGDPSVRVDIPGEDWLLTLQPSDDDSHMFLIANSGCVHVSPAPKTG